MIKKNGEVAPVYESDTENLQKEALLKKKVGLWLVLRIGRSCQ